MAEPGLILLNQLPVTWGPVFNSLGAVVMGKRRGAGELEKGSF